MPKNILVATPQPVFGELLRLSLEESSQYRVRLVQNAGEVYSSLEHISFDLTILDATLPGAAFPQMMHNLRTRQPQASCMVLPPDNNQQHPLLGGLSIDAFLSEPFYAPDLMETVEKLLTKPNGHIPAPPPAAGTPSQVPVSTIPVNPVAAPSNLFEYLADLPSTSAQLEGLLKQTEALAVLLMQERTCQTAVGSLSQPAVQEVTHLLGRYILSSSTRDLTRSVRLESEKSEYTIYATLLAEDWRIGVVFSTSVSFTHMRSQALFMRRELLTPRVIALPPQMPTPPVPATLPVESIAAPVAPKPVEDSAAAESETLTDMWALPLTLNDLLASMPSPDPEPGAMITLPADEWLPADEPPVELPVEPVIATIAEPVSPPVVTVEFIPAQHVILQPQAIQPSLIPEVPASSVYLERQMGFSPAADVSTPLEDTRPLPVSIVRANSNPNAIEPGYPAMANLAYTSVLVPRQPQHFLTGPYASQLSDWMPQICSAFGWRLESLSIRPDYLQWTVQVNPTISPGNVVRIIRQYTSQRLFTQFSQSRFENPAGDFWASGYLIVSGSQPPSPQLLRDFISQTRRRQGVFQ